ncbi:Fur-regulated basic protein FbpA [Cytobacillus solani]|uniref:Fur-regulated basic protein FbpA n=1 Tax=Cytobacillus solani TaxID=1637975 RepID=UPI002079ACD1|nr:Fur-regulated basic protein FbpA [Cytobacillus solani]USK56361.1 Fur-regulated basic protein FbpA [Cytobacillus solani]
MRSTRREKKAIKDDLIEKLISLGYTKMLDGRQLYELSTAELWNILYIEQQIEEAIQYQEV